MTRSIRQISGTCYTPKSSPQKVRGVALITAMLIVALVTVAAASMAARQNLDIRRAENMLHIDQAYMYALGAEEFAKQVLNSDEDKAVDTLAELKLLMLPPTPVEGGTIEGTISELSGAFPVNNMIKADGSRDNDYFNVFRKLVSENLQVHPEFPNSVIDWIDIDVDGNAEDLGYLSMDIPFRTSNSAMVSDSEFLMLFKLNSEPKTLKDDLTRLYPAGNSTPLVSFLPHGAKINVNTAPADVLQALDDRISDEVIQEIQKVQNDLANPFKNIGEFKNTLKNSIVFQDTKEKNAFKLNAKLLIDVKSEYFKVVSIAKIGRAQVKLHSLVKREDKKVTTLRRAIGVY